MGFTLSVNGERSSMMDRDQLLGRLLMLARAMTEEAVTEGKCSATVLITRVDDQGSQTIPWVPVVGVEIEAPRQAQCMREMRPCPEYGCCDCGGIGVIPAGTYIDAEGKWIDRIEPPVSEEAREILLRTLADAHTARLARTHARDGSREEKV